jgi:ADP-ribosylglycohydrolase
MQQKPQKIIKVEGGLNVLGAIIGDIAGSVYEFNNRKSKTIELFHSESRFTDDTVLTLATMDALLNAKPFASVYKEWYRKYPAAGYGAGFRKWAEADNPEVYQSWGNGSAMRVSPVGWYFETLEEVLEQAQSSAAVSHNHREGIKGAQATAAAVFLARTGQSKMQIKKYIEHKFNYDLNESLDSIRKWYQFDVSCQGSVPQAFRAFLEAKDYEDTLRNAISIGGDSDTLACIAGGIAEAYYGGIPEKMKEEALKRLDAGMWILLEEFYKAISNQKRISEHQIRIKK